MLRLTVKIDNVPVRIYIREPRNFNKEPNIPFRERVKDPRVETAIAYHRETGIRSLVIIDEEVLSWEHYNSLLESGELVHA